MSGWQATGIAPRIQAEPPTWHRVLALVKDGQSHPELDRQSTTTVLIPLSAMFFFNDSEAVMPRIEKK
jgi:hypothetical protein